MDEEVQDLVIESVIGFDGVTVNGLKVHPDGIHIIYPLGCSVIVQNWKTKTQKFLIGHTNVVCQVDVSPNGKYIASGQINHMGFRATVIIWDYEKLSILSKYETHKVRVESVVFSCDSAYLLSLGGRDDASIVVWDVEKNEAISGSIASMGTAGDAYVLCPTNRRGVCFISGGEATLRVWRIDPIKRHVNPIDVKLGLVRRRIICIAVDERDEYAYCGTTTGDLVKISLNYDYDPSILDPLGNPGLVGCYGKVPTRTGQESAERYSLGITALLLLQSETDLKIVIAAGDGRIDLVKQRNAPIKKYGNGLKDPCVPQLLLLKTAKLDSGASSIQILGQEILAGTVRCEIYTINMKTFDVIIHVTCHTDVIYDIAFPNAYSGIFATSSKHDIRVWNSSTSMELLRITVANFSCTSVVFTCDGTCIISGWNDGVIRGFTPQTGRLMFEIPNAHNKGVTSVAVTACGTKLLSGGAEGMVKVWEMHPNFQKLLESRREHKGPVSTICINKTNTEAVTACADGTCIVWDIENLVVRQTLFADTQFLCARFIPNGVHIITAGGDRKIGYWETFDGSLIRELEGSTAAGLTSLDISPDGNYIVSASCDMYIKLWKYREGITTHVGVGHAAVVTGVKFSPDSKFIISVSADGAIFRWACPFEYEEECKDPDSRPLSSRSSCSVREAMWPISNENGPIIENVNKHESASKSQSSDKVMMNKKNDKSEGDHESVGSRKSKMSTEKISRRSSNQSSKSGSAKSKKCVCDVTTTKN